MKELYVFLSELVLSHDDKLFVDLYKDNYKEDVISTPCVLVDISNINLQNYKKDVLLAEVQGKLYYMQEEYTDSNNQSNTRQHSLQILENVQKLVGKMHLASNEYFSQISVQSISQLSEVTNTNTFVVAFGTYFLLKRESNENVLTTLNLHELLTY